MSKKRLSDNRKKPRQSNMRMRKWRLNKPLKNLKMTKSKSMNRMKNKSMSKLRKVSMNRLNMMARSRSRSNCTVIMINNMRRNNHPLLKK